MLEQDPPNYSQWVHPVLQEKSCMHYFFCANSLMFLLLIAAGICARQKHLLGKQFAEAFG